MHQELIEIRRNPITKIDSDWTDQVFLDLFDTVYKKYTVRDFTQSVHEWITDLFNLSDSEITVQNVKANYTAFSMEIDLFEREFKNRNMLLTFQDKLKKCQKSLENAYMYLTLAIDFY